MGAAHVTRLAGEGATVYAADIHKEGLERTTAATPDRTRGRLLDVTSADAWSALVTDVMTHHGRIDFLVNNAGVVQLADAVETSEAEWDRTMAINAKGVFLGMKHVVPVMQRQGAGSIVNISSVYGLVGTSGYVAYTASKGAVTVMTKAAAATHGPAGIRVNSVHPGVVYTPMLETELSGLPRTFSRRHRFVGEPHLTRCREPFCSSSRMTVHSSPTPRSSSMADSSRLADLDGGPDSVGASFGIQG